MSILDIFKSKKVLDSSPVDLNDKGMGGINYIDSHAYESRDINITEIAPIRTFDNMPAELSNMAYRNFSSWQNYAASIGVNNSLAQYSHHILNRLSYQECANLATDSMISKAIDVIVREIFKSGGKWEAAHLDIDNFEMVLNSLDFYNKIRLAVQRALEYGGAFIYINTDDTNLSLPLYLNEKTASTNKITGLTVIEPWQAAPVQVNSFNPLKSNYMEPDLWWVLGASTSVHKTRLIPVVFYSVPDLIKPLYNYLGLPLSFYMKNYVSNADTVRQSISDLILRFRTKIIKTTAQKIADPQTQARVKYMNATSNNLATLLLAKDEEWIETVTSLSGMDNLLSQMYELMTASTRGIPVTKLLGLSPRGFNATGEYDENNFYDVIDGYAKSVVIPVMEKAAEYVLCFKAGILDEPKYEFNPRKQIKQKEQAEINNLKADYISKLIMSGVVTGKDAIRAISEDNFKFDWIDLEDYNSPENPEIEKEIFNKWMDSLERGESRFSPFHLSPDGADSTTPAHVGFRAEQDNQKYIEDDDIDVYIEGAEWRTLKNGKRVLIDTETGELLLGGGDIEKEQRIRPEEWGTAYTEYSGKGQVAVNFLLDKKEGYVPDVITVAGYGVDIPYGEKATEEKTGFGLIHIIERRNKYGLNGEEFVKNELIPLLKNGISYMKTPEKNSKKLPNKLFIETNDKKGLLSLDWYGSKQCWLLSGFFKIDKNKN